MDRGILAAAMDSAASPQSLADAAVSLESLAGQSGSSTEAYGRYHATMHELHVSRDPQTEVQRRWLAARAYPIEESLIQRVEHTKALSPADFSKYIREQATGKGRINHPLAVHLSSGSASKDDLRRFVFHNWRRSGSFYEILADFARRLDLATCPALYRNLYDETGCGEGDVGHPFLLARLMEALDLDCAVDAREPLTAGQAYLNNRIRCMRHGELAWGWGITFSLECMTSFIHAHVLDTLKRFNFSDELCQFYSIHSTLDVEHAAEIEETMLPCLATAEAQAAFLTAMAHHQSLGRAYYDEIWRDLKDEVPFLGEHNQTTGDRA